MEDIKNIIWFCVSLGTVLLCFFLVISGVFRWLALDNGKKGKEQGHLNILSWGAFFCLCSIVFFINKENIFGYFKNSENSIRLTVILINTTKIIIKILLLIAVVTFFVILLYEIMHFIKQSLKLDKRKDTEETKDEKTSFSQSQRNCVFLITYGILIFFIIMPLIAVSSNDITRKFDNVQIKSQNEEWVSIDEKSKELNGNTDILGENEESLLALWQIGVKKIVNILSFNSTEQPDSDAPFYAIIAKYLFAYIIILGMGYAAIRILKKVIKDTIEDTTNNLLTEYSSPISLLAVAVAMLWTIIRRPIDGEESSGIIWEVLKTFGIVIIVVALVVLTLEIIRLLIDIRTKLIRQEAKYIFISLIGQASMLLLSTLHFFYGAINNIANNQDEESMDEIQNSINEKIISTMQAQLDDDDGDYPLTFSGFDSTVTKK